MEVVFVIAECLVKQIEQKITKVECLNAIYCVRGCPNIAITNKDNETLYFLSLSHFFGGGK